LGYVNLITIKHPEKQVIIMSPNYFSLNTPKNKNMLVNQRSPIKLQDLLYEFIEEALILSHRSNN
jgi:hypothetical protein